MRDILYGINYIFLTHLLQSHLGNGYTNIALNKNVTQVSTLENNFTFFGASNANDGKRDQFAANGGCMHTNYTDPEKWWTIDFGKMYTIESVDLLGRTDCCPERHSDFEIRIHNTSDWNSRYNLCYTQIGQAPTELYVKCSDHISGKYLTVYKKDDYHHYPLTLCEVEVYGNEVTGNTINTHISMPTTLTISNGNHITHKSRPKTLGTSLSDHKTHENNLITSFNIHGKTTGYTQWIFKELFPSKQWNPSSTPFYLFIQSLTALVECLIICTGDPRCRAVFIYEKTCLGLSSLTPNSKLISTVRVFIKQPLDECNGWDFVYYNGLCMLFSAIDLDWFEARTYCENKNSHLLVLDSEQKVNETKEFLQTYYHDVSSLYVGASDETKEGEWKWVSNISGYFNFLPGQPNNGDATQPNKEANCGAVISKGELDLYDVYCYVKRKFICEM